MPAKGHDARRARAALLKQAGCERSESGLGLLHLGFCSKGQVQSPRLWVPRSAQRVERGETLTGLAFTGVTGYSYVYSNDNKLFSLR